MSGWLSIRLSLNSFTSPSHLSIILNLYCSHVPDLFCIYSDLSQTPFLLLLKRAHSVQLFVQMSAVLCVFLLSKLWVAVFGAVEQKYTASWTQFNGMCTSCTLYTECLTHGVVVGRSKWLMITSVVCLSRLQLKPASFSLTVTQWILYGLWSFYLKNKTGHISPSTTSWPCFNSSDYLAFVYLADV